MDKLIHHPLTEQHSVYPSPEHIATQNLPGEAGGCLPFAVSTDLPDFHNLPGANARQQHLRQSWAMKKQETKPQGPSAKLVLQTSLENWVNNAASKMEKTQRRNAVPDILGCFANVGHELDLSDRGLQALPDGLDALMSLKTLKLANNPLREFPASALLALPNLQTLELAMNRTNSGEPVRQTLSTFRKMEYTLMEFRQGNAHAVFCNPQTDQLTACYTTDLSPCLALMIWQETMAACIHVDSFSGKGMGGKSTAEVLRNRITPDDEKNTRIFLVGANDPGSAGNVRGVLACLRELGLENCVTMASLGNGHTSAILDVKSGQAYVGFA